MRKFIERLFAVLLGAVACPLAASPSPEHFLDANQFQIAQQPSAYLVTLGDMYDVHLGQTMRVEIGGVAVGVLLPVYCTTGTLIVRLMDGALGGPVIAEGRINAPTQPWYLQRNFIEVPFTYPAKAPYYADLALEVFAKGGECYFALAPTGSDYPNGNGYAQSVGSGGWVAFANGVVGDDIPFALRLRN